MPFRACAIIPAAGKGDRLPAGEPKQFLALLDRPVLAWSTAPLAAVEGVELIVVGAQKEKIEKVQTILGKWVKSTPLKVVEGGSQRQETVRRCLEETGPDFDLVVIHDAVRPFVKKELVERTLAAAVASSAATAAIQPWDTIKVAHEEGARNMDRERLWLVQTPQAFYADLIKQAHQRAAHEGFLATDDTALVERLGKQVTLVPGDELNMKITTPFHWQLAIAMARAGMVTPEV